LREKNGIKVAIENKEGNRRNRNRWNEKRNI
jgi:hypothetical protein